MSRERCSHVTVRCCRDTGVTSKVITLFRSNFSTNLVQTQVNRFFKQNATSRKHSPATLQTKKGGPTHSNTIQTSSTCKTREVILKLRLFQATGPTMAANFCAA